MSPEEAVAATKEPIGRLGGAFMLDPTTMEAGRALGLDPWAFYYGGRAGVLGPVEAAVVAAALVFLPPASARKGWAKATAVLPPAEAVRQYTGQCHRWGREHLRSAGGLDRLCALAGRVVQAADAAGLPVFAGWRAVPLPTDPAERAAQLLHVLREHRGGLHGIAVISSGLSPLEAIMSGPLGAGNATFFGWPEPYPDPGPLAGARAEAERLTDRLVARAYAVLSPAEADELAALVGDI